MSSDRDWSARRALSEPTAVLPRQPAAGAWPPRRVPRRRRSGWGRRIGVLLAVLMVLLVALLGYWDAQLKRVDALADYTGRPAATAGTNWLVVGSDSRAGLSPEQEGQLATGDAQGQRTDTMMLVHTGSAPTALISLPRDTYLPIPGNGRSKLNAAYAFGGPALLVRTVEQATRLRIDHYAEIGFDGFAGIVDAVGGVDICVDQAIKDPKAGLDVKAGCQTLDGPTALGYVRTRAFPNADLERVVHQRQFLAALVAKAAGPGVLLNPFQAVPFGSDAVGSLTVDSGTHLWSLAGLGLGMRGLSSGDGVTTTVPIGGASNVGSVGAVITWDRAKSQRLFTALAQDQPVPADLVPKR